MLITIICYAPAPSALTKPCALSSKQKQRPAGLRKRLAPFCLVWLCLCVLFCSVLLLEAPRAAFSGTPMSDLP